jgi:sodium-coupled neutral amino acid transporter 11
MYPLTPPTHLTPVRFYENLKDRTPARFAVLTALGFGASVAFFGAFAAFGFLTFGSSAQGMVLNNYASTDALATAARVAILASMVFGYPLTFVSFRDGSLELAGLKNVSRKHLDYFTCAVLACLTCVACNVRNLGLVSAVGGAILGSAIIYIAPCAAFLGATSQRLASGALTPDSWGKGKLALERTLNRGGVGLGLAFAVIGAVVSLSKGH